MTVKKIMTFKSGNFVFSNEYSKDKLSPLIIELRILYKTIKDLPILPSMAAQLESELIRRSIFSTAAIEGNPLKEDAVGEIIDSTDKDQLTEFSKIEIRNLKTAYDFVKKLNISDSIPTLDEKFIKNIHKLITINIDSEYNNPGVYRNHIVKVGDKSHGGVYTPLKCLPDIKKIMQEYISWINNNENTSLEPIIRAALAHYYFGLIHPFSDGNGRASRIIEATLLKLSGIKYLPTMLSNFYYRNMDEYFIVFSATRKNKNHDVTPFLEFVLKGCIDSLNDIKERITYYIRKFALRDYYIFLKNNKTISQRQKELLNYLLEMETKYSFTLNSLFNTIPLSFLYLKVSNRTARRDLQKLEKLTLLKNNGTKYFLNWRSLDAI